LDQKVGNRIFKKVILEYLSEKTRILVVNDMKYISFADRIILIEEGEVI
jgi:ATP-binding cassette, subfamily C (CFTR/MRP), member 1